MHDAVGDKEGRKHVDGVVEVPQVDHYGKVGGSTEEEVSIDRLAPKGQSAHERHPRMRGEELVLAKEGARDGRAKVARVRRGKGRDMRHHGKARADDPKEPHRVERKGQVLRMPEDNDDAHERHDKSAVHKIAVDIEHRRVGEYDVAHRVASVRRGKADGIKVERHARNKKPEREDERPLVLAVREVRLVVA